MDKVTSFISTMYIKIIAGLVVVIAIAGYIAYLKFAIKEIGAELAKEKANYSTLLVEYTVNAKKYNAQVKEYETISNEISANTENEIQQIANYKGEPNENDCDVATRIYNGIKF